MAEEEKQKIWKLHRIGKMNEVVPYPCLNAHLIVILKRIDLKIIGYE